MTQDTGKFSLQRRSDDGKTISQTIVLNTPNKEHVIDPEYINMSKCLCIRYLLDKRSGVFLSRASNDGGNTICPMVKLNSTSTKSIFYFILFFR